VIARDTSEAAHGRQLAMYRATSPSERVAMAIAMSDDVRELARGGIRARHPDYSPREVELALVRLLYGDALVRRAWPTEPLLPP